MSEPQQAYAALQQQAVSGQKLKRDEKQKEKPSKEASQKKLIFKGMNNDSSTIKPPLLSDGKDG